MTRHFYNFVAIFNWCSKTNRRIFFITQRNKLILVILDLLVKEGVIAGYELPKIRHFGFRKDGQTSVQIYSSKKNNYYTPIKIFFKDGPLPIIKTIGSPGKRFSYSWKKLDRVTRKFGPSALLVVSSSRLKKICDARELIDLHEGARPLFVIVFEGKINI